MGHIEAPSRRAFLQVSAAVGGGLLLGIRLSTPVRAADPKVEGALASAAGPGGSFTPSAFIRIEPSGRIVLVMRNTEFGQGIWTSASMLIAEELEVGLDQITAEAAPPDIAEYADPLLGEQATGGSASIRGDWKPLREAGAVGRTMLVQAAATRWGVEPADCTVARGVVTHAGSGRSLPYGELAEVAATLPIPVGVALKDPAKFTLIGTSPRRLDTPSKVDGTAVFGIDVKVPGMAVGTLTASPVKGGKLKSHDAAAAKAVPGVRDVVALDDMIAVIGEHYWAAKQGLEAAAAVWDDGSNAGAHTEGMIAQLDAASKNPGVVAKSEGDADGIIARSAKKLEVVYQLPFLAHAPMEPVNATLHIRPDGADLWAGTQVPLRAQAVVAKEAGLSPDKVSVHNQYMGGAFGRRLDVDFIAKAARIAKHVGYPVKIVYSREEDIRQDLYRPYYYDRISAGLDAQGNVTAWSHRTTGSSVMARWAPPGMKMDGKLDPDTVECAAETPYAFPAQRSEWVRDEPDALTTLWWRGVGPTHNVFVVESFMDELAAAAGKDPLEFRRGLIAKENPRALAVLNLAAEKAGWGKALPAGSGRGIALQFAFGTLMATVAEVSVGEGGEVGLKRITVAVDCGPVVNPDTVRAQVQGGLIFGLTTALYNEITLQDGRVQQSNFHDYRVMRIDETPLIDVHIVDNPSAPIGGIGETGTVAAAPALGNAIFAATGRRLRRTPFATGQLTGA